jgi:HEAT repeat protein
MGGAAATIAVVIRFKDEIGYLPAVLSAVAAQRLARAQVRIIGIDNGSVDGSREVAGHYCDRVLAIGDYRPGAAINLAMREEACDFGCVLSAHTIPASDTWLQALLTAAAIPGTLAVYGAQLYPLHSRFLDKRDLDIFSTMAPRIETADSDLWNANAMFPRASWDAAPFDERPFELEDHYWTKCRLDGTNVVRFVPDALVYHYSHIERLDRVFLPETATPFEERLAAALAVLQDRDAEWPDTMMAALAVKSMPRHPAAIRAIPALIRLLEEHWDFDVRWRVAGTLAKLPDPAGTEALITALADPSFYARDEAAWALVGLGAPAARRLMARLGSVPRREWPLAALALGRSGLAEAESCAIDLLQRGLAETTGTLRRHYLYAAGEIETAGGLAALAAPINALVQDPDPATRAVAVWAAGALVGSIGELLHWPDIRHAAVADGDPMVRAEAAAALGKALTARYDPTDSKALRRTMADCTARVRFVAGQAVRLLAQAGKPVDASLPAADDPDYGVRFERALLADVLKHRNRDLHAGGGSMVRRAHVAR